MLTTFNEIDMTAMDQMDLQLMNVQSKIKEEGPEDRHEAMKQFLLGKGPPPAHMSAPRPGADGVAEMKLPGIRGPNMSEID